MAPDVTEYIRSLKDSPKFGPQVVCHKTIKSKKPHFAKSALLEPELQQLLNSKGIEKLYTHQAKAIEKIMSGRDIIVATPTASGKSMIYNLPVLNDFMQGNGATSLYLFPLKALAQDQRKVLENLYDELSSDKSQTAFHFQNYLMEIRPVIKEEKFEIHLLGHCSQIPKCFTFLFSHIIKVGSSSYQN